jgi:hypothetical protein
VAFEHPWFSTRPVRTGAVEAPTAPTVDELTRERQDFARLANPSAATSPASPADDGGIFRSSTSTSPNSDIFLEHPTFHSPVPTAPLNPGTHYGSQVASSSPATGRTSSGAIAAGVGLALLVGVGLRGRSRIWG